VPLLGAALAILAVASTACSSDNGPPQPAPASVRSHAAAVLSPTADPYATYASAVYQGANHWVCSPLLTTDPCRNLTATTLNSAGKSQQSLLSATGQPSIDCFYVYPTVSNESGINADLTADGSVRGIIRSQAGPYSSVCRVFAPVYRQLTLAAIDGTSVADTNTAKYIDQHSADIAYADVLDAWRSYIAGDNHGRGVVLIGDSQGSMMLKRLLHDEIEPRAALRQRVVSSILLGGAVLVPDNADTGGDLASTPPCRSANQIGCVIAYSAWPADTPPTADALFGRAAAPGQHLMCVNPAALSGGTGSADVIAPAGQVSHQFTTSFVTMPDALTVSCQQAGRYGYLAVSRAAAGDKRPLNQLLNSGFKRDDGLHGIDPMLTAGDLIRIVAAQAVAFGK
jgi:hypothetical protein